MILERKVAVEFTRIFRKSQIWVFVLLLVITGCQKDSAKDDMIEITGFSMGTSYSIKIVKQPGSPDSGSLRGQIEKLLSDIDERMSTYLTGSEVSEFNSYQKTDWFSVSQLTFEVVKEGLRISQLSQGAFDITIGGLVELWGFGSKEQKEVVPDKKTLAQLLRNVGYKKIELREKPPAIRKIDSNIVIDLSAIAKGYAVDRVTQYLEGIGVENFLVEVGGEIRTRGLKQKLQPWRVAIERPLSGKRSVYRVVAMNNMAMATSGDYRNFFELNGTRYSHTLDPKTGRPIRHELASVTVIHRSCMTADGLATTLMVLGPQSGIRFARENQIAALFISRAGSGFEESMTAEFKSLL